jgi:hypothetical protein
LPQVDLEQRIEGLRQRLERLLAKSPSPAPTFATNAFSLLADGEPVATLMAAPDGSSSLTLTGEGTLRLGLGVGPNGCPNLMMFDGQGAKRVSLEVAPNACPALYLNDATARPRAELTVDPVGAPSLGLRDATGLPRIAILVRKSGEPIMAGK